MHNGHYHNKQHYKTVLLRHTIKIYLVPTPGYTNSKFQEASDTGSIMYRATLHTYNVCVFTAEPQLGM